VSSELDRTRPAWRQVAAAIEARIASGEYPVGARVPSVVELSNEFDIAASTAQKALAHLKAEGLVRAEVGLGSFVTSQPPTPADNDPSPEKP
jgi:DNA-binding GntR family transcriptional regulator